MSISFVLEVRFYYYLGNEQTKQEKKKTYKMIERNTSISEDIGLALSAVWRSWRKLVKTESKIPTNDQNKRVFFEGF